MAVFDEALDEAKRRVERRGGVAVPSGDLQPKESPELFEDPSGSEEDANVESPADGPPQEPKILDDAFHSEDRNEVEEKHHRPKGAKGKKDGQPRKE